MIDWLRRSAATEPVIEVAGQSLPLAIRRHPRAKRLTMRLAPDGSELRVTMPAWGRMAEALDFAHGRSDWIAAQLARVPQPLPIGPGMALPYRGGELVIDWHERAPRKPALAGDDRLVLGGPAEGLPARLARWLEGQALVLLAEDLAFYCARAGVPVPALRLSRARRRWGSCSSARSGVQCVRINWRLVMAPDLVRRSVVAHEVAHLVHFDHSPRFHALLAQIYEHDLKAADRWLAQQGRTLAAAFG